MLPRQIRHPERDRIQRLRTIHRQAGQTQVLQGHRVLRIAVLQGLQVHHTVVLQGHHQATRVLLLVVVQEALTQVVQDQAEVGRKPNSNYLTRFDKTVQGSIELIL